MKIIRRGDGEPEHAIVACVHGDELCGKRGIDQFLDTDPTFLKPVKFILANEAAMAAGTRFVDEDLNRCFPGNPEGDTHEKRLAAALSAELDGCAFIDLHSTRSSPKPFALVGRVDDTTVQLVRATGLSPLVDIGYVSRGMIGYVGGVAIECGLLGSDGAAENAADVIANFLAATGVVDGEYELSDPTLFKVFNQVTGSEYEFIAENFELVERGETFARREEARLVADEEFYPVLMSTDGYDETVGFQADRLGTLSEYELHRPGS